MKNALVRICTALIGKLGNAKILFLLLLEIWADITGGSDGFEAENASPYQPRGEVFLPKIAWRCTIPSVDVSEMVGESVRGMIALLPTYFGSCQRHFSNPGSISSDIGSAFWIAPKSAFERIL